MELPAELQQQIQNPSRQFGDLKNLVRTMENPTKQSRYNNIANDNKPILVYEELSDH